MKKNKILGKKNFEKKNLKNIFGKNILKFFIQLQAYILSKFQIVQTTASLCHNVVSHKKVKEITKAQKRGLATTVQPEPDFSRACGFCKVLGINEHRLNAKFHRNR